jgi:hypothetical protein
VTTAQQGGSCDRAGTKCARCPARALQTLFFAKVLRSATEEQVRALFAQYGVVKELKLFRAFKGAPTNKVGGPLLLMLLMQMLLIAACSRRATSTQPREPAAACRGRQAGGTGTPLHPLGNRAAAPPCPRRLWPAGLWPPHHEQLG